MHIIHDIEQAIARIESDISRIITLSRQHIETADHDVESKFSGIKNWLEKIKAAIFAGKQKVETTAEAVKTDMKKL